MQELQHQQQTLLQQQQTTVRALVEDRKYERLLDGSHVHELTTLGSGMQTKLQQQGSLVRTIDNWYKSQSPGR